MEFITTDNTEIAAKINKVIKNELLSYTCQLFLISPYGKPEPEGSGVFVKLDESYYIFTASHVAKHLKTVTDEKSPTLCVRGIHNNSYVTVLGSVVGTELKEKGEGVDLVDLAYIKLQEDFLGQINFKYKFLSIEKIRSHRKLVPASQYCVVGFPVKNEWVNE